MTSTRPLWHNPDPIVRETYRAQTWLYLLSAPFLAMIQYAPFLAVKTFDAAAWVPALAAIIPASHLLALFFAGPIQRSDKTAWVVRPMVISSALFGLLFFVDRTAGWMFALVIILAQSLRAPIISAQSAIFRANYPPAIRSFAMSIPMAVQFLAVAAYSGLGGRLFDRSEDWVIPYFAVAGALGIGAAWAFRGVRVRAWPARAVPPPTEASVVTRPAAGTMVSQWAAMRRNRGFALFQWSYMFFGAGAVAITAVMPHYLNEEFQTGHESAALAINTIPMLAAAVTFPLWGLILDRGNPLIMRTVINGVWSLTPLLLFFARSLPGVYAAQLIQGLVFSGSVLIWWLGVNYFARREDVALFMALHQTLTGVRGILTPFIGVGLAHQIGYRRSMIFWFALMVIGFGIMLYEVIRERRAGALKTFSETEAGLDAATPVVTDRRAEIG